MFSCKIDIVHPWQCGEDDDILTLNLIIKTPDNFSVKSSSLKLTEAHNNGERNPYKEARTRLVRVANNAIIKEGLEAPKTPTQFKNKQLANLAIKWEKAKTELQKTSILSALYKKLEELEAKMV